jgi:hypothetical protein
MKRRRFTRRQKWKKLVVKSGYQKKNIASVSYLMTLVVVCDHNWFSHICYTLKIFGGTTTTSDFFAALLFLIGTKNPTFPKQNGLINEFNCYVNKLIILMKATNNIQMDIEIEILCPLFRLWGKSSRQTWIVSCEDYLKKRECDEKLKRAKSFGFPKYIRNWPKLAPMLIFHQ